MNGRIKVFSAGNPQAVLGYATCEVGMRVMFHGNSGGSGDDNGDLSNTDYLEVTAVDGDIITAVSHTSSLTYKEYAMFTSVKHTDTQLVNGGAWPTRATHFPFA